MDVATLNPNLSAYDEIRLAHAALSNPIVVFGISLKGKKDDESWAWVEKNLDNTIANLSRQVDKNFLIVVAGHDRPKLSPESEALCLWLQVNWPRPTKPTEYNNDKRKKRYVILSALERAGVKDFYFFTMDADDYLHPHLCKHIRADNNGFGYFISKGYIYDVARHKLAKLAPKGAPFYKHCGSCAAIWTSSDDFPKGISDKETIWWTLKDHTSMPERSEALGRPLSPMPFYAGLYLFNHGFNTLREQNLDRHKLLLIDRRAIDDEEEVTSILNRFKVDVRAT